MDGRIKIIEEIAPVFKNQDFIIVLRELIVNIVELYLFCEIMVGYRADSVPAHFAVGDGLLRGLGDFPVPFRFGDGRRETAFLRNGQFGVGRQENGAALFRLSSF